MKIPNDATISTTTGLVMIEFGESNMQIEPDTKLTISEKVELIWGKIKNSHKALEKCNYDFDVRGDRTAVWHGGKHEFVCVLKTSNGSFAVRGTEYILEHDKQTQITTLHLYEGVVEFKPTNSDNITVVNAGTTAIIENGKISTKILTQSAWDSLNDEFKPTPEERVPGWIKNNAKWWAEGQIGDSDFTGGIQHLIKEKIIDIPDLPEQASGTAKEKVPDWIKNNAGWWADGQISEDDFVNGIKWLVENGIIRV